MPAAPPSYPPAPRDEAVVDVLHGHAVPDPFRPLEDPDAPATRAFCAAQNGVVRAYLDRAAPFRARMQREIEEIYDYDKYGTPHRQGRWFYYSRHRGLENQAVVMQSPSFEIVDDGDDLSEHADKDRRNAGDADLAGKTAAGGKPKARVFIDPNVLSEDGTASLGEMEWSEDGVHVAYGVQRSGSDWADIHIMNADSLQLLPETLEWAKFYSIAWTHDNKGFYYCRYPTPESLREAGDKDKRGAETDEARNQAVYYHVLNTPQHEDRLVVTDPENSKYIYGLEISDDGKYLFVSVHEDCAPRELLWYVDLSLHFGREADNIVHLIHEFEARFSYVANDDTLVYLHTNLAAPRYKLIAIDLSSPERVHWRDIIAEHSADVLNAVYAVHQKYMAVVYMRDVSDLLELRELANGELVREIPLPSIGKVSIWAERAHDFLTLTFTSFLYPGSIFYCDVGSVTAELVQGVSQSCLRVIYEMRPPGFDPSLYCTRQAFYKSKDGTRVPMFIVGPKEEMPNAKLERPCLLYGYGGFCISLAPYYSVRISSWLRSMKGVYVVANIRGGSEYGDEWHNQGIIGNKQNVFDDFQYAAMALIGPELSLTVPEKLMIMGGSNGGLLVGACVNQAPELFGAAVAQVGVLDMYRFTKFTIGSAWVSDYGDPASSDDFAHLARYSPLHHTFSPGERGVPYPAILLTTGSHDDRVVPLHSLKFAATLQERVSDPKSASVQGDIPILLRVDIKAGHGAGKPTSKVIEEMADTMTFAALALKLPISSDEKQKSM